MTNIDERIQEALTDADRELLAQVGGEPSLPGEIIETFRGRHRWWVVLVMIYTLVFFGLGIVSAVQFFGAETTRDQIMWAAGFLTCMMAVAMLKQWYWMELNKNALTREIKRLELQIARLSSRTRS